MQFTDILPKIKHSRQSFLLPARFIKDPTLDNPEFVEMIRARLLADSSLTEGAPPPRFHRPLYLPKIISKFPMKDPRLVGPYKDETDEVNQSADFMEFPSIEYLSYKKYNTPNRARNILKEIVCERSSAKCSPRNLKKRTCSIDSRIMSGKAVKNEEKAMPISKLLVKKRFFNAKSKNFLTGYINWDCNLMKQTTRE